MRIEPNESNYVSNLRNCESRGLVINYASKHGTFDTSGLQELQQMRNRMAQGFAYFSQSSSSLVEACEVFAKDLWNIGGHS